MPPSPADVTAGRHASFAAPEPELAAFLTPMPGIRPRHRAFPGHPRQAARAREFTRRYLGDCPAADDAELLTSEIITNAIRHSHSGNGGTVHIWIAHRCHGTLRIAVTDDGPVNKPEPASLPPGDPGDPDGLDDSGRGLAIVRAIATDWGHRADHHATTVWFEIHCQPAPGTAPPPPPAPPPPIPLPRRVRGATLRASGRTAGPAGLATARLAVPMAHSCG